MGRDQHDDRKRALVLGKFKFLYQVNPSVTLIIRVEVLHAFAAQDDTEDLETTDKFKLAVVQNKLLGPVVYR